MNAWPNGCGAALAAVLVGVIATAAVILVSVVGVYTARLGNALAESHRQQTETNRQREIAQQSQRGADVSRAETRRQLYSADMKLAGDDYHNGNPRNALKRLEQYVPVTAAEDLREFAWYYLWHRCHHRQLTLRGHTAGVLWSGYSHSGNLLATASQDGSIRLWQTNTGQPVRVLNGHDGDVNCISFSPDDRWLASAGMDATVRIWDVTSGRQINSLNGHNEEVFAVQFSPSGRQLASGGRDRRVQLWDTTKWTLRSTLEGHHDLVESLAFSPDERTLASGGADSIVHLWDLEQLKSRFALPCHSRSIYSVCFSPNGGRLAMGTQDGQILLWDLAGLTEVRRTQASKTHVTSVAFAPMDAGCCRPAAMAARGYGTRRAEDSELFLTAMQNDCGMPNSRRTEPRLSQPAPTKRPSFASYPSRPSCLRTATSTGLKSVLAPRATSARSRATAPPWAWQSFTTDCEKFGDRPKHHPLPSSVAGWIPSDRVPPRVMWPVGFSFGLRKVLGNWCRLLSRAISAPNRLCLRAADCWPEVFTSFK